MTDHTKDGREDAFKTMMAEARASGRPELAHQSLGRPLSDAESDFADALMAIYAEGVSAPEAIAAALSARGVPAPSDGRKNWTADGLAQELKALNADLDAAYQENGFGA